MANINIRNILFGGLADSDYLGAEGSVSDLYQLDIHGEPGIIKLNQKLTAISQAGLGGDTIDTPIVSIVYVPDTKYADAGHTTNTYGFYLAFGSNGKTWALTVSNQTTREVDGIQYLGQLTGSSCRGAAYFNSYVYYSNSVFNLGRMGISSPIDVPAIWSGKSDTWQTTLSSSGYRPTLVVNDTLYMGNSNLIASVTSAGAFNAAALDIDSDMSVATLDQYNTDIVIGSISTSGSTLLNKVKYYRWNTTAASFSFDDMVPEAGIRSVVPMDNDLLVIAGILGNTYTFNGNQLDLFKRIKPVSGAWPFGDTAKPYNSYSRANHLGKPLFGMENTNNAPIRGGVYSFARHNKNYPYVFAYENDISSGNNGALVGPTAMVSVAYQLLVAWEDKTSGSYVYGIDKYDSTAKCATGHFTTRYILLDRDKKNNYAEISVPYRSLPTNTAVKIYVEKNYAGSFTEITDKVTDTDRMIVRTKVDVGAASALRVKIQLVGYQNTTPEIEGAIINVS